MYEVSATVRKDIANQMDWVLEDRNYPYSNKVVADIVNNSIDKKSNLIDMFSKHSNWNPDKLMIQFDEDYSREFNRNALYRFCNWIEKAIAQEDRQLTELERYVIYFIQDIKEQFFNETMNDDIARLNSRNDNFKLRNNMKSSKAILKLCKEMGWDKLSHTGELYSSTPERPKYDSFDYEYAMLCDNINPIKTTRHTCLSLNPVDFLLMSNGTSWESCHYIDYYDSDPGCYSSGTISYMLDECSFIFYTVDADFCGEDIELEEKLQRQVFGYKDEVFIQSRLYPQSMDCGAEAIYTDIRNIVQKVISDCLEKPNLWTKTTSDVNDIVEQGYGATCYPDWRPGCPGSTHCSISKLKGTTNLPKIILGAKPICIECGGTHHVENSITCCSRSGGYYCAKCDSWIDEDDVYWVHDEAYCGDCTVYCEDCGDYEVYDDATQVYYYNRYGNKCSKWVCTDCLESYSHCDCCDEYWHDDDIIRTEEGNYYCPECNDSYGICEECDEYHDLDELTYDEVTEKYYCQDCYEKLIEEREEEEKAYEEAV